MTHKNGFSPSRWMVDALVRAVIHRRRQAGCHRGSQPVVDTQKKSGSSPGREGSLSLLKWGGVGETCILRGEKWIPPPPPKKKNLVGKPSASPTSLTR